MFFFNKPAEMPEPGAALPGRLEAIVEPGPHHVNGRPIAGPYPAGFEVAEFALGCFWGAEKGFWQVPGVWVTAVGYQGGHTPNATYREACSGKTGHAEAVRVVFDPSVVTYDELLRHFWEAHDPTQGMRQGNDIGTQYRSAIFPSTLLQRASALASRDAYQARLTAAGFGLITTDISNPPAPLFYLAEEDHQQYLSKNLQGYNPAHGTGVACSLPTGVSFDGPAPEPRSPSPIKY